MVRRRNRRARRAVARARVRIINIFLLPSEIKNNYERDGRESPVSGVTGLWILLPLLGSFIWVWKCQSAMNDFWASKGAPAI